MPAHYPIMKKEVLEALAPRPGMIFIDGTMGAGGHSAALWAAVQPGGRVHSFDRDPEAVAFVEKEYPSAEYPGWDRRAGHASAAELPAADGFLFDSGWSSRQLDLGRGFSFQKEDEPLNLKYDPEDAGPTAQDWIDMASEREIADVLSFYGEEPLAERMAKMIAEERPQGVGQLAALAKRAYVRAYGPGSKRHPATKTWQALRLFVNRELENVERDVLAGLGAIKPLGRVAVISFHSLEDRLVKQLFRYAALREEGENVPESWQTLGGEWLPITKEPIEPSDAELAENPASHSAKLRVLERVA